jgi:hypothetical protein
MRSFLLIMAAVVIAQGTQTVPPVSNPADNATVEGTIFAAAQTRPLEGIPVYLTGENEGIRGPQRTGVSVTDSEGRFRLKDVPPGDYIVVADRFGYFRAEDNPTRLRVTPRAEIRNVTLRMVIGGSISGRIVDINNRGLAGAAVSAMQAGYLPPSGQRQLQPRSDPFAATDDRGDYRVRGLRPGTYYMRASISVPGVDATAYYPGTPDESSATPIVVREGQELVADFRVDVKLRPVFTISGVVTTANAGILNRPIPRIFVVHGADGGTRYENKAGDPSGGRFEIRNIPAGTYELYPDARDADGRLYTSRTTINLVDRNIENLTLPVVPTVDVIGRVLLNGEAPGGRLPGQNNSLNIQTVQGLLRYVIGERGPGPFVDPQTGEFTITGMPPGIYKLSVSSMPPDAYLEDLRQIGASVHDEGFAVTDRPGAPLQVLLASPAARVEGIVRGPNQEPVATVRVVLIPEASRRQEVARFRTNSSDKDGKFVLSGIPPGTYKLFAIDNFPENAWRNAEFMQPYDYKGHIVTLAKGASISVDLPRIPWEVAP